MTVETHPAAAKPPLMLTISRVIDAPPELVFRAWTSQEHAAQWWGPLGFVIVSCRLDARPGGTYRVAMRSPEGTIHTKRGMYREVTPPERLAFTYAWEDATDDPGHEMLVTITFQPRGGKTLLTLHHTGFESAGECDSHRGGWTTCLERFADFSHALTDDAPPDTARLFGG